MKILITGAAGFIGHHLARALSQQAQIVALDDLSGGDIERLRGVECQWTQANIEDPLVASEAAQGCDWIIHLAALASVAASFERPAHCMESNMKGLLNVLEAARKMGKPCRVLFASSCAVYGDAAVLPQHEELAARPSSAYAASKLSGEHICAVYSQCYQVPTLALRFFNVYGHGQSAQSAYSAVIPRFVDLARRNQPLIIYGNGEQTRDFIHIQDIILAISLGLEKNLTGIFNVGTGYGISVADLARKILQITGSHSHIQHASLRPGEILHSYASIEKLEKKGFRPTVSLEKGLQSLVE